MKRIIEIAEQINDYSEMMVEDIDDIEDLDELYFMLNTKIAMIKALTDEMNAHLWVLQNEV